MKCKTSEKKDQGERHDFFISRFSKNEVISLTKLKHPSRGWRVMLYLREQKMRVYTTQ